MKRISDAGHIRQRETVRIGQGEHREPVGPLPVLSEELFPLATSSPSLLVQMGDELGSDAGQQRG